MVDFIDFIIPKCEKSGMWGIIISIVGKMRRAMHKKVALILIFMSLAAAAVAVLSRCTSCLSSQLEDIETAVIQIRQLEELEDSALNIQTRAEYEAELAERFEADYEYTDGLLFYRALDLVEPDVDLDAAFFDLLATNVGGYYDPEAAEMTVILDSEQGPDDELPLWDSLTYAHEFAHALQDQHYDLETLIDQVSEAGSYDLQLAVDALIEGDASLVTLHAYFELQDDPDGAWWLTDDPLSFIEWFQTSADTDSQEAAESEDDIPAIIKAAFMFPYDEGLKFVAYLVKELGWAGVDRAFRENPPQTTEHIYYPRRYLAGDDPLAVSLPDPRAVIGGDWRLVYDSSVGEFYLRHHLETAPFVTYGWGGDRMRLFTDEASGDLLWVWQLAWDSARDADEFSRGYRIFLNQRYGIDGEGPCWTADETHCFRRVNDTETRITYAADSDIALALLNLDN